MGEHSDKDKVSNAQLNLSIRYFTPSYAKCIPHFQFGKDIELISSTFVPGYQSNIPTILVKLKTYLIEKGGLDLVGIFRMTPTTSALNRVKVELNMNTFKHCDDLHVVAKLIKVWFRELPQPIFHDEKVMALLTDPSGHTLKSAQDLIAAIKEPAQSIFMWLVDLCILVSAREKVNKMSPRNCAIVFGPNLIPKCDDLVEELRYSQAFEDFFEQAIIYRGGGQQEQQSKNQPGQLRNEQKEQKQKQKYKYRDKRKSGSIRKTSLIKKNIVKMGERETNIRFQSPKIVENIKPKGSIRKFSNIVKRHSVKNYRTTSSDEKSKDKKSKDKKSKDKKSKDKNENDLKSNPLIPRSSNSNDIIKRDSSKTIVKPNNSKTVDTRKNSRKKSFNNNNKTHVKKNNSSKRRSSSIRKNELKTDI